MAAPPGYRTLEVTLISAKDLKDVSGLFSSKMECYAVASLSGDARTRQRTPTDREGGQNPTWNCPLKFYVPAPAVGSAAGGLVLEVLIRCEKALGDTDVGEVHIPVRELESDAASAKADGKNSAAAARFLSYQVRRPSGRGKGILNFSYKFSDPVAVPAAAPPPALQQQYEPVAAAPMAYPPPAAAYPPPAAAYPPPAYSSSSSADPKSNEPVPAYPPPHAPVAAAYPATAAPYPPPPGAYPAYPPAAGYGATQPGYGYPAPPPPAGYGYPPPPPYGYAGQPVAPQKPPKKGNKFGLGLGAGLLGGALGGLIIGDAISDAAAYDSGYDAGFDDGGGFDF